MINQASKKPNIKNYLTIFIFAFSFLVYLKTLAPTVTFLDSGDFLSAIYTLGIPHPPGYPLYTILGKLFSFIPVGELGYRVALLSAFFAAIDNALIYLIVLKITQKHIPAIVAAFSLGFSFTFWSQATIAETYTLNIFFLSLIILMLLKWEDLVKKDHPSSVKYLYLIAFLSGLALTNHLSTGLFLFSFLFFILDTKHSVLNRKTIPVLIFLFIIPLTLYSYEPIRASANPEKNWGNPNTIPRLIDQITVRQYRYSIQKMPPLMYIDRLKKYPQVVSREFSLYLALLSVLGIIWLFLRKDKKYFVFLIFLFLTVLLFLARNATSDIIIEKHNYLPGYLVISIFIGLGADLLVKIAEETTQSETLKKLSIVLIGTILIAGNLNLLVSHYHKEDKSGYYFAYDYATNVLDALRPNAILFSYADNENLSLEYMQIVEKKRKDVIIIHTGMLLLPWYKKQLETKGIYFQENKKEINQIVKKSIQKRPIYSTIYFPELSKDYDFKPLGPIFEIVPKNNLTYSLKEIPYRFRKSSKTAYKDEDALWAISKPYFNKAVLLIDSKKYNEAISYIKKGLKIDPESIEGNFLSGFAYLSINKNKEAIYNFKKIIEVTVFHPEAYKYLGLAYLRIGLHEKALDNLNRALDISPRSPFIHYYLGLLYSVAQHPEDAISEYKTALKYKPEYTEARYALAVILEETKKYKEALKEWELIVKDNPTDKLKEESLKRIENLKTKIN
ncbi:MAG: DUF2723 domain-containing protein [Actinobacteria bacterium]|nr:DUF2723 domain-containing protein [Actinomycetota bacterium]